jgi:hypothetical protein
VAAEVAITQRPPPPQSNCVPRSSPRRGQRNYGGGNAAIGGCSLIENRPAYFFKSAGQLVIRARGSVMDGKVGDCDPRVYVPM